MLVYNHTAWYTSTPTTEYTMPPVEEMDLIHKAVLFEYTGSNTAYNEPRLSNPVEISCRWRERRTQTVTVEGQAVGLDATVVVNRIIPVGSLMWKGRLSAWDDTLQDELMRVETVSGGDELRGVFTRRTVGLTRYKADLPGVGN